MNLKTKPAWYLALYAAGQVPALEQDGAFVPESLVTAQLLEELHPAPALLPTDPWRRAADSFFIQSFSMVSPGCGRGAVPLRAPSLQCIVELNT